MDREELFGLYKDEFVRELVNGYKDGDISSVDEIDDYVRGYSIENGYEYEDVNELLNREIERQHIFER